MKARPYAIRSALLVILLAASLSPSIWSLYQ